MPLCSPYLPLSDAFFLVLWIITSPSISLRMLIACSLGTFMLPALMQLSLSSLFVSLFSSRAISSGFTSSPLSLQTKGLCCMAAPLLGHRRPGNIAIRDWVFPRHSFFPIKILPSWAYGCPPVPYIDFQPVCFINIHPTFYLGLQDNKPSARWVRKGTLTPTSLYSDLPIIPLRFPSPFRAPLCCQFLSHSLNLEEWPRLTFPHTGTWGWGAPSPRQLRSSFHIPSSKTVAEDAFYFEDELWVFFFSS